eukprot:3805419-Amphidinium_carterae.1
MFWVWTLPFTRSFIPCLIFAGRAIAPLQTHQDTVQILECGIARYHGGITEGNRTEQFTVIKSVSVRSMLFNESYLLG